MTREQAVALGAIGIYMLTLWVLAEAGSWRQRRRLRNRERPAEQASTRAWLYGPYDQERAW